ANVVEGVQNIHEFELIPSLNVDFAIISNPTSEHRSVIEKLIPYNIPMFIEKPLFSELGQEQLVADIIDQDIKTYVACNLRFLHSLKFAKDFIAGKRVNEVNIYCGSYLPDWRPGADFRKVYSANADMGGGVHIDLIHELDYTHWLFGRPDKITSVKRNSSSLAITAFDYTNFIFEYPGFTACIVLNYYRKDSKRACEIVCEDGTLVVDLLKNTVQWNGEEVFSSPQTIIDTYPDQIQFFNDEILSGNSQFNNVTEAYQILKACLQAN
ncbi:MAG: Gfo/Idh/MocA family oxidoreductase, partial [Sphingobacteriales bacterium]